jgi:Zn-dependent protease
LSSPRSPRALTVARLAAVDIVFHWRWAPIVVLGTALLAYAVLPMKFPTWQASTTWLVAFLAVTAGEAGLFLHELSHAIVGRRRGHIVTSIEFHGFVAETIVSAGQAHDVAVALVGPAVNVAIAGVLLSLRLALRLEGPFDVLLVLLVLANLAVAITSLQPFGESDGARALRAFRVARAAKPRS